MGKHKCLSKIRIVLKIWLEVIFKSVVFWCTFFNALNIFLSNIYTLMDAFGPTIVGMQIGIEPPTFQLLGNLLHHLSYSHPNFYSALEYKSLLNTCS